MEIKKQYAYFSAAILDGASLKPQSGTGIRHDMTCAIGAGVDALGMLSQVLSDASPTCKSHDLLAPMYPYLDSESKCPCCSITADLFSVIWHVNDGHGWTREQIAAWLYEREEELGFVTLTEPLNELSLGIQYVEQHGQASLPESVTV